MMQQNNNNNSGNNMNSTSNSSYRLVREACVNHPEEEVQYFCFDCKTLPICSECVVFGSHKGHNVSLLKKAFPMIIK